jgi:hypothetical protein
MPSVFFPYAVTLPFAAVPLQVSSGISFQSSLDLALATDASVDRYLPDQFRGQ